MQEKKRYRFSVYKNRFLLLLVPLGCFALFLVITSFGFGSTAKVEDPEPSPLEERQQILETFAVRTPDNREPVKKTEDFVEGRFDIVEEKPTLEKGVTEDTEGNGEEAKEANHAVGEVVVDGPQEPLADSDATADQIQQTLPSAPFTDVRSTGNDVAEAEGDLAKIVSFVEETPLPLQESLLLSANASTPSSPPLLPPPNDNSTIQNIPYKYSSPLSTPTVSYKRRAEGGETLLTNEPRRGTKRREEGTERRETVPPLVREEEMEEERPAIEKGEEEEDAGREVNMEMRVEREGGEGEEAPIEEEEDNRPFF